MDIPKDGFPDYLYFKHDKRRLRGTYLFSELHLEIGCFRARLFSEGRATEFLGVGFLSVLPGTGWRPRRGFFINHTFGLIYTPCQKVQIKPEKKTISNRACQPSHITTLCFQRIFHHERWKKLESHQTVFERHQSFFRRSSRDRWFSGGYFLRR